MKIQKFTINTAPPKDFVTVKRKRGGFKTTLYISSKYLFDHLSIVTILEFYSRVRVSSAQGYFVILTRRYEHEYHNTE